MDLSKIAYTPAKNERKGTVRIEWTESRFNAATSEFVTDERTLRSTDQPHPHFLAALQALDVVVASACLVTEEERESALDEGRLTVRSVTLRQFEQDMGAGDGPEEVEGVTITALRELDWVGAPLVLNTPFAPVTLIPHPLAERAVERLKTEAVRFIEGKRAQASLFGDGVDAEVELETEEA